MSIPAALALVFSAIPYLFGVWNPIIVALILLKLFLARSLIQNYWRICSVGTGSEHAISHRAVFAAVASVGVSLYTPFVAILFLIPWSGLLVDEIAETTSSAPSKAITSQDIKAFTRLVDEIKKTNETDTKALPSTVDVAVTEIKQLLQTNGLDRKSFPEGEFEGGSFNPQKHDPVVIEERWEKVRQRVVLVLNRRLDAELSSQNSLRLFIARVAKPEDAENYLQVVLPVENSRVGEVLRKSLSLPRACFPEVAQVNVNAAKRSVICLRNHFHSEKGTLWTELEEQTRQFINDLDVMQEMGFQTEEATVNSGTMLVSTNWRPYREQLVKDMMWRFVFEVRENATPASGVLVSVRFQLADAKDDAESAHTTLWSDADRLHRYWDMLTLGEGDKTSFSVSTDSKVPSDLPFYLLRPLDSSEYCVLVKKLLMSFAGNVCEIDSIEE